MTSHTKHKKQDELIIYGKLPPQALQLEEAVLGALMMDSQAWNAVEDTLTPDCFYTDANKSVFRAIQALTAKSHPVDLLTVTEQVKKDGANVEPYYVVELTNRVASAANIEFHAKILKQKAIQRQQIEVCQSGLHKAYDETSDAFEALEALEKDVFNISNSLFFPRCQQHRTLCYGCP